MNGRKLKKREKLIRPNELDERYCLHHIRFCTKSCYCVGIGDVIEAEVCKNKSEVIAVPEYLHCMCGSIGPCAPHDFSFFAHQFMTLQVITQLYNGFDDLLNAMIEFDDFKSYKNYKFWSKVKEPVKHEKEYVVTIKTNAKPIVVRSQNER